jgi:hypothetical protein
LANPLCIGNVPIIQNGSKAVPPELFNVNATGRVSPIGNFEGLEDSIEYFFALAPIPSAGNSYMVISNAKIVDFSSGCPEVASSVVYLETRVNNPGASNDGAYLSTLKEVKSLAIEFEKRFNDGLLG